MTFTGKGILQSFALKNEFSENTCIVFRFPKKADAKAMVSWINTLRSEACWLGNWRNETLKSETAFIRERLVALRRKTGFMVVVEINGQIVGGSDVTQLPLQAESHVGRFGIGLLAAYTGKGLGEKLGRLVLRVAKKETSLRLLRSSYHADNAASAALHKKLGFRIAGKIPRGLKDKNGAYGAEVLLYRQLR